MANKNTKKLSEDDQKLEDLKNDKITSKQYDDYVKQKLMRYRCWASHPSGRHEKAIRNCTFLSEKQIEAGKIDPPCERCRVAAEWEEAYE